VPTTDHDNDQAPAPDAAERRSRWGNAALLLASLVVSLLVIEVGYRLAAGISVFKLANWRTDRVLNFNLGELKAIFDPVLGWTDRPSSVHVDGYTTIEHGIRTNFGETAIRRGGILAVGDSFTEGWEVKDRESWPAVLERLTHAPVLNGGVGGYGTDQIVLRAERLLPIIKPKILIVGFLEQDIFRAGHSVFGAPKPYFTLENGELRYHPPKLIEPRPSNRALATIAYGIREALGYSAAADYLFARLNPNYWYSDGMQDLYTRVGIDEVAVTCALLKRLKVQTDRDGIRMMLFMQYYAPLVLSSDKPTPNAQDVVACAQAMDIRVVDQFASLRAIVRAGPADVMREYYWYYDDIYGHMTAKGNEHAAGLIHPALRDWLPLILGQSSQSRDDTASGAAAQR
jgi:hypothetical protein